jgi:hypothetical protein
MRLFLLAWAVFACGKSVLFYADEAFQQATYWAVLGAWASIEAEIKGR